MPNSTSTTRFRFWLWLIRAIGIIVPRRLRADWKQEWEAELRHRELLLAEWDRLAWRNKLDLLWRSASALWDALWLQSYRWEDEMFQDLRFGVRLLLKNRSFTAVAVLSLALGIGANTAIFSLVDVVLLKSLPVRRPEQLVALDSFNHRGEQCNLSYPVFKELPVDSRVFSGIFACSDWTDSIEMAQHSFGDMTGQAEVQFVSGEYFEVLGVDAIIGRTLSSADDVTPGAHPVAVLSYGFWQRCFGGNRGVAGQEITLKEKPFTIVGVAPSGFFGESVGRAADIWIPLVMQPSISPGHPFLGEPNVGWLRSMARLQPDASVQQAQAALSVSLDQLRTEQSGVGKSASKIARIDVFSGRQGIADFRNRFAQRLLILMAVVVLVLLIACANVANLLLARGSARQKEVAVRLAIGAGRFRLVRQFFTETLLLAGAGGALGLLVSYWGSRVLLILASESDAPIPIEVTPNARILGFTFAVSVLTAVLFGLAPALIITRQEVNSALKNVSPARPRLLLSRPLVVVQVALSLLLLTGAGLFVQTLRNLRTVKLGFEATHIVQARIDPRSSGYKPEQLPGLYQRLLDQLNSAPGVRSVSLAASGFEAGRTRTCCIAVEGYTHGPDEDREIQTLNVTPGYFRTMGLPLLMGRDFNAQEADTKPGQSSKVAIINETMARYYFGEGNPLGRRLGWGDQDVNYDIEIVGVARDASYGNLRHKIRSLIYFPSKGETLLVVRAAGESAEILATVRQEIQAVDKSLVPHIRSIPQLIDRALVQERLVAKLSTFFSLLALVLASIGLYGVMSYDVARSTREIGIRVALGATRQDVVGLVMQQTMLLVVIGVVIGLGAALLSTRWLTKLLYGLTPNDPLTIAVVSLVLLAVAAVAGYLPARRAARVDPMVALRHE